MKKLLGTTLFLLTSNLFASTFFSGEGGGALNFINNKAFGFDPVMNFSGFLGGQLTLSNSLSLQGEFSIQTADLFDKGITKEAPSTFRINEISATFTKTFAGATHTLTFFKGYNESIGTQKFIQRRLGTEKFSSILTENYLGQNGISAYEVFGTGGSYSLTLRDKPLALGLIVSRNNENSEDVSQLNTDLRAATSNRFFTLDFLAGLGAPLYTKNSSDEDVVLLIDTLYLHTGFDFLLGNKYSTGSLFCQCGFEYFPVKSSAKSKSYEWADTYILIEPRFKFGDARLQLSVFNIPQNKLGKSLLLEDGVGGNFSAFVETMYKNHRNYSAGIHCMVSFEGRQITNLKDGNLNDCMNMKFCPFTKLEADNGELNIMLQANVTKFADSKPGALKLHIGYKKDL